MKIATPIRKSEDKVLNKSRELGVNRFTLKPNGADTSMLVEGKVVISEIGFPFQDLFNHYLSNIKRIYKEQRKSDKKAEITNNGTMYICKFHAWDFGYKKVYLDTSENSIEVEWDDGYKRK